MVSKKQLKANRQNSKLGGVKTQVGKEITKYNAQKHGILRQTITEYEEDTFDDLLERFDKELKPKSIVEKIIVERLVINYIKLFRAAKAESEYIKSILNPKKVKTALGDAIEGILDEKVVDKGYSPKLNIENVEDLLNIYQRYSNTLENRFYKGVKQLKELKK